MKKKKGLLIKFTHLSLIIIIAFLVFSLIVLANPDLYQRRPNTFSDLSGICSNEPNAYNYNSLTSTCIPSAMFPASAYWWNNTDLGGEMGDVEPINNATFGTYYTCTGAVFGLGDSWSIDYGIAIANGDCSGMFTQWFNLDNSSNPNHPPCNFMGVYLWANKTNTTGITWANINNTCWRVTTYSPGGLPMWYLDHDAFHVDVDYTSDPTLTNAVIDNITVPCDADPYCTPPTNATLGIEEIVTVDYIYYNTTTPEPNGINMTFRLQYGESSDVGGSSEADTDICWEVCEATDNWAYTKAPVIAIEVIGWDCDVIENTTNYYVNCTTRSPVNNTGIQVNWYIMPSLINSTGRFWDIDTEAENIGGAGFVEPGMTEWLDHWYVNNDTAPPLWENQSQNSSRVEVGGMLNLSAYGYDALALVQGVLWTNETGAWQEKTQNYSSPQVFDPPSVATWEYTSFNWSNDSVPIGTNVTWFVRYHDTTDNQNSTDNLTFTITEFPPCVTPSNNSVYYVNVSTTLCTAYYNNTHIRMNANDIFIDGNRSTIDGFNNGGVGADTNDRTGTTIRNFGSITNYQYGIMVYSGSHYSTVHSNVIHGNGDRDGIVIGLSTHANITNNTVYDNNRKGIWTELSHHGHITNNTVYLHDGTVGAFIGEGIKLQSDQNTTVTDNIIYNNTYGINLNDGSGGTACSNNVIANNTIDNSSEYGIYISFALNTVNNHFYNNPIVNSGTYGLYFRSSGSFLNNFTVENSNITNSGNRDIYLSNLGLTGINATLYNQNIDFYGESFSMINSTAYPDDPTGYQSISQWFNITNTSSNAILNLTWYYDESAPSTESNLLIGKYDETWSYPTYTLNTVENYIFFQITEFSSFAILEAEILITAVTLSASESMMLILSLIFISAMFIFFYFKLDIDPEKMFRNPLKYVFFFIGFLLMYTVLITEAEALTFSGATELSNLLFLLSTAIFWILVFVVFYFAVRFLKAFIKKKK